MPPQHHPLCANPSRSSQPLFVRASRPSRLVLVHPSRPSQSFQAIHHEALHVLSLIFRTTHQYVHVPSTWIDARGSRRRISELFSTINQDLLVPIFSATHHDVLVAVFSAILHDALVAVFSAILHDALVFSDIHHDALVSSTWIDAPEMLASSRPLGNASGSSRVKYLE